GGPEQQQPQRRRKQQEQDDVERQDVHVGRLEFKQQRLNDRDIGLLEKVEDVHFLGVERVLEAGGDVGNLGQVDREQENVRHVDLPRPPQDAGAGDDEAALAHFLAVDESGSVAGDEHEDFSGVAEAVVAQRSPGDKIRGNVVEEDQPERDPTEQVEPQVASSGDHRGMHSGDLSDG